jgi:hypothetical protein
MRVTSFPCLICIRRAERSASRTDSFSFRESREAEHLFSLDLRGEVKERYEAVRRKVEAEIAKGTRTAGNPPD